MASEKLHAYYCSREWGLKKEAVHKRSGGTCERCELNKGQAVHHKTYIRLYNENLEDLIHLCNGCHDFTHGKSDNDPATYETEIIKIGSENYDNALLCPHCSSEYLHHTHIINYDRAEDEETIVTVIEHIDDGYNCETSLPAAKPKDNPSARRHGLEVQFYCEACTAISKLRIAQHKGITYMSWKVTNNANLGEKL